MKVNEQPTLNEFLAQIGALFEKDRVETIARETKFVQRQSKLTGHIFLITYTFAMSIYANPTLEQLTALLDQVLKTFQQDMSRVGLHQRINEYAVTFFEAMLSQVIAINLPSSQTLESLRQFEEVIIVDSTSFQVPATLAHLFAGSGGKASDAAIKIRFGYDLKSGRFFYHIQEGNTADNKNGNGVVEEVSKGSLRISDLGFFTIQAFCDLQEKGAYYLSRMKSGVNLYQQNEDGEFVPLDLVEFATQMTVERTELTVYLKGQTGVLQTRIVIERVPEDIRKLRVRRMNEVNRKKGRTTSPRSKILAGVNLYITNAPPSLLPGSQCRLLYRIRWQIELIFKLWKSNFALEQVAGIRKERVLCTLYAKLLCIFVTTKLVFWARNAVWNTRKRELSEYRASKVLQTFLPDVRRLLLTAPSQVITVLREAMEAMMKRCIKSQQRTRRYPLDMLDEVFSSPTT